MSSLAKVTHLSVNKWLLWPSLMEVRGWGLVSSKSFDVVIWYIIQDLVWLNNTVNLLHSQIPYLQIFLLAKIHFMIMHRHTQNDKKLQFISWGWTRQCSAFLAQLSYCKQVPHFFSFLCFSWDPRKEGVQSYIPNHKPRGELP